MVELIKATKESISKAATLLQAGSLVAFPTETVYGLGADALNDQAVASIFVTKGRPQFNPLIVHIADVSWVDEFAYITSCAKSLMNSFFPAPLTLVLKRKPTCKISYLVSAGLDTIALRMPSHQVALDLIKAVGRPIAAPSANISGSISPTTAQHVQDSLGDKIPMILDAGACAVGVESTVLQVTENTPILLRAGGVSLEEIKKLVGTVLIPDSDPDLPRSPGQLASHYAPRLPVRLNAITKEKGEALLGFGKAFDATLNLSESGDLKEAASHLFAYLRALDTKEFNAIAVMPIPDEGLGLAINDRLKRASFHIPTHKGA